MADQQELVKALQTKLTADETAGSVHAAVGGRIYNGPPSLDTALPFLSHFVVTDVPRRSFTEANAQLEVQIDIYHNTSAGRAAVGAIADKVFALMDNASLSATGWTGVQAQCTDRGGAQKEEDAFRVTQLYTLWGTAT